jgi:hypothetical protein
LIEGELDEAATESLKVAARNDSVLAQAIVEAWTLQKNLDQLSLEKAPVSLSQKLQRIPREQKAANRQSRAGLPRWALAAGLSCVMIISIVLIMNQPVSGPEITTKQTEFVPAFDSSREDAARLELAQQQLETAFFYLDKTGFRASQHINQVLREGLSAPVKDELTKHIPYFGHSRKEKKT